MEQILDLPVSEKRELTYAGFWIRYVAYVIDYIVYAIFSLIVMTIFGVSMFMNPSAGDGLFLGLGINLLNLIAYFAYHMFMETSSFQGTLGKMAVGIKVGKANRERLTMLNSFGRLWAKGLSMLIIFVGCIMAAFHEKKRSLHDILADTYVFYGR